MKELNVCEENGETTTEMHPITIRAVKAEEIREVKTSDKKTKQRGKLSHTWQRRHPQKHGEQMSAQVVDLGAECRLGTGAKTAGAASLEIWSASVLVVDNMFPS